MKKWFLGLIALSMIFNISCRPEAEEAPRPNLVFVLVDQLRHDWLGFAGDMKAVTPHLDRLADEGVSFKNTVAVSPVCAAMRASLFTGKYTSSTGMVVNELRIHPDHTSIAHVFKKNGYETGYIGKWHLWANEAGNHDDPKNASIPPGPHRLGFDGLWKAYNFHHSNYDSYYFEDSPEKLSYGEDAYEPEAQFDFAMDFIEEASSHKNPFALFLCVGIPHPPWRENNVPQEYYEMFRDETFDYPETWIDVPDPYMDRDTDPERWLKQIKPQIPEWQRVYYAMVTSLDAYMGRLAHKLEELGLTENTLLVFTSDHGEMMGENGRIQKMIFYDAAARVPFLVKWPGKIPAGMESDVLLNTPDIMPTLLSLLGLPIPKEVEGMDLSFSALGKAGKEPEMAFLQGMGHTYLWIDGAEWRAVRNERYTYATYLKDGKELLFDHQKDPCQIRNLVDDPGHKKIRDIMKSWMQKKMASLNDEFKPCTWYRDSWTDGHRNIISSARGPFKYQDD